MARPSGVIIERRLTKRGATSSGLSGEPGMICGAVNAACVSSVISSDRHLCANPRTPSALQVGSFSASQKSAACLNSVFTIEIRIIRRE